MLDVKLRAEGVFIGERFSVSFQRTQRITGDLHAAPPPPSWGALPVHSFRDYPAYAPQAPAGGDPFFIPLAEEEAVWLGFNSAAWKPHAVKVGVDGRDAVTGGAWRDGLSAYPQNYVVCPPQLSLEGVRAADGSPRQIVADPAGPTLIRLVVYEPFEGRFPEAPPPRAAERVKVLHDRPDAPPGDRRPEAETLGRRIEREILPDAYGTATWDARAAGSISVYVVGSRDYRSMTGLEPPRRPTQGEVYGGHLLP